MSSLILLSFDISFQQNLIFFLFQLNRKKNLKVVMVLSHEFSFFGKQIFLYIFLFGQNFIECWKEM